MTYQAFTTFPSPATALPSEPVHFHPFHQQSKPWSAHGLHAKNSTRQPSPPLVSRRRVKCTMAPPPPLRLARKSRQPSARQVCPRYVPASSPRKHRTCPLTLHPRANSSPKQRKTPMRNTRAPVRAAKPRCLKVTPFAISARTRQIVSCISLSPPPELSTDMM